VAEWLGHEVGVDFRFFEPSDISQAMERAGFRVEMRLERLSYPQEVQTRRAYQLARRHGRTREPQNDLSVRRRLRRPPNGQPTISAATCAGCRQ
jgi:hypothetical protein